eukprot:CAMPEP_0119148774 /NCGR_PEP_ID=MMETSP1310-20130426/42347_1 /TAXON_ID=464262 /ORGANISM="Genus nov. species nov., Strain RCC2339" /LENGTH=135 /DNA_ID=CAMNT_0007140829 /DNA_START=168 /DNA_END=572 /DNA_ORIENTATION=-
MLFPCPCAPPPKEGEPKDEALVDPRLLNPMPVEGAVLPPPKAEPLFGGGEPAARAPKEDVPLPPLLKAFTPVPIPAPIATDPPPVLPPNDDLPNELCPNEDFPNAGPLWGPFDPPAPLGDSLKDNEAFPKEPTPA